MVSAPETWLQASSKQNNRARIVGDAAGYVEQFDTLVGELTVTEMLLYTAELKRSRHESSQVLMLWTDRGVCSEYCNGSIYHAAAFHLYNRVAPR